MSIVISLPVILLWNVKIPLGRKFGLWGVLCLSVFTAITAIVKVAGGNISHGQVDSAWAIFWIQAEAAVAVIVVSVSAFRTLFVAHRVSKQQSPVQETNKPRSIWGRRLGLRGNLPAAPSPTFTGVRTYIRQCPYDTESLEGSRHVDILPQRPAIMVTQDMSSESVAFILL